MDKARRKLKNMAMRRTWIMAVAISLFTLQINVIHAATSNPKPGAACTKLGASQVYKGLKFTCSKSGKKLIWNKGVSFKLGESCNKKNETALIGGKTAMCTLINEKLTWQIDTYQKLLGAWQDTLAYKKAQPLPNAALDVRYSPLVNRKIADAIVASLKSSSQFWQAQFLPAKPFPTLFFTEKEKSWFGDQMTKLGLAQKCIDQQLNQFDEEVARNGENANAAGYAGCDDVTFFDFYIGTGRDDVNTDTLKVGAHEYTHSGQFGALTNVGGEFAPCWFIEGGAEFYGITLSALKDSDVYKMRQQHVWEPYMFGFKGLAFMDPNSIAQFIEENGINYNHQVCGPNGAYPVGAVATEYLFLQQGQTGILKFMEDIKINHDFKSSIQKIYGISWEQMKNEMSDYIKLVIAQTPKPD